MEPISLGTIIAVASTTGTIGGAYLTIKKIQKEAAKERELEAAKVLQQAKEDMAMVEIQLQAEIENLRNELKNFETSVEKDLSHMRETYNGEIRNLGQKIEDLRSELRNQHGQLVQLLTKMIDNRD